MQYWINTRTFLIISQTIFKKYFKEYPDNYVIIGGTACDIIIDEAGFTPRATKDIDIILVVEALSADFVKQFWKFIQEGNYEQREKSEDDRKYYRFIKPDKKEFPFQIELFSRNPDLMDLKADTHLTPIPVDSDFTNSKKFWIELTIISSPSNKFLSLKITYLY